MGIYGHGWGMMAGMFLFWALVLAADLWLMAHLFPTARVSEVQRADTQARAVDPAVQVARQRCASGQISKSEYDEVLRTLERTTPVVDNGSQET